MFSSVISGAIDGISARQVNVEVDTGFGIPSFEMSGGLSSEVKEARERVRIAIKNSGFELKPQRIAVNISPAELKKEGTGFDLPIAVGILASNGIIDSECFHHTLIIGELSLNGKVNPVKGILPNICMAKENGFKRCIVPKDCEFEGSIVEGLEVFGVDSLKETILFLVGKIGLKAVDYRDFAASQSGRKLKNISDFGNICGQYTAKRAAMVAAAGRHNLLYIGPPGSGKTLLAKCIPSIMPNLTFQESLDISKVFSIAGLLTAKEMPVTCRPFRSPHHTITRTALIGGGKPVSPGEITLSAKGVLFMDELTEFYIQTLESLRQPLEDRTVTVARLNSSYVFPADFLLVAAMNPCKCGYYPDKNMCNCSEFDIRRYMGRISQPVWDRFDLCVETSRIKYQDLCMHDEPKSGNSLQNLNSMVMKCSIEQAVEIQEQRYHNIECKFNSDLTGSQIKKYCHIDGESSKLMERVYTQLNLTARGYHKILKTARTIADLDLSDNIKYEHLCEAVSYRSYDNRITY